MAQTSFRQNAERARAEADAATLDNVRDRCLRAEAAWMAMADREERVDKARARNNNAGPVPAAGNDDIDHDQAAEAAL